MIATKSPPSWSQESQGREGESQYLPAVPTLPGTLAPVSINLQGDGADSSVDPGPLTVGSPGWQ